LIQVDTRAGSNELIKPLRAAGLPVEEAQLEFGDLGFLGRGEGGLPLLIGIEHKKLPDLVQSLNTDRLAGHQLTGMLRMYDRCYLIIEGEWDVDGAGRVITPTAIRGRVVPLKGAPLASVLEQRVLTLEHRGGLRVRWTRNQQETIRYVHALFRFWCDRDLDDHRSHLALHAVDLDRSLLEPVSDERRVYAAIPSIGYTRSAAVEKHFPSLWAAANALEAEWQKVDGIGKKLASNIVTFIRGRKGD
jgi:ERCC4-type nuclease